MRALLLVLLVAVVFYTEALPAPSDNNNNNDKNKNNNGNKGKGKSVLGVASSAATSCTYDCAAFALGQQPICTCTQKTQVMISVTGVTSCPAFETLVFQTAADQVRSVNLIKSVCESKIGCKCAAVTAANVMTIVPKTIEEVKTVVEGGTTTTVAPSTTKALIATAAPAVKKLAKSISNSAKKGKKDNMTNNASKRAKKLASKVTRIVKRFGKNSRKARRAQRRAKRAEKRVARIHRRASIRFLKRHQRKARRILKRNPNTLWDNNLVKRCPDPPAYCAPAPKSCEEGWSVQQVKPFPSGCEPVSCAVCLPNNVGVPYTPKK
jgi:hypothetical protein